MKILSINNIKNHKTLLISTCLVGATAGTYIHSVRKVEQDTYSKRSPKINDELLPELKNNSLELNLKTTGNQEFKALDINPRNSSKYIIYCNGMWSSIKNHQDAYLKLLNTKCGIIGFDYPGTGISSGSFSKKTAIESTESVYNYLLNKGIKPENIAVIGHSMGCAVASEFASKHNSPLCILISPFNTARNEVKHFVEKKDFTKRVKSFIKPIPPCLIPIKYRFNNEKNLKNISAPLLIIASKDDAVVPVELSRKLKNKYNDRTNIFYQELDTGGHKADNGKLDLCIQFIDKNFR